MSRLTELLWQARKADAKLGADQEAEIASPMTSAVSSPSPRQAMHSASLTSRSHASERLSAALKMPGHCTSRIWPVTTDPVGARSMSVVPSNVRGVDVEENLWR